jgi:glycosyltransferase involved in cell wall biosynthesis
MATNQTCLLVTIGIPTYNRAGGYLREALASALKQTYPHIEIVVSDNCSTDHTEAVVKSFADPRIRYFKHPYNIGANNNFNFCVEQARGDYFLLLHDDDLIDPDFVETCMRRVDAKTDIGLIRTGTRVIDADGSVRREVPNTAAGLSTVEFFRKWFDPDTAIPMYLCSSLFNTERLREIGGLNSKHNLFQDVMAEFQLAAKFGRIDIYEVKASFRKHAAEMTHSVKVSQWCEDSLLLLDLMCDLVPEHKELIQREGLEFLARRNYSRAKAIKAPLKRLAAYLVVFSKFHYRYPPPVEFIVPKKLLPSGVF